MKIHLTLTKEGLLKLSNMTSNWYDGEVWQRDLYKQITKIKKDLQIMDQKKTKKHPLFDELTKQK